MVGEIISITNHLRQACLNINWNSILAKMYQFQHELISSLCHHSLGWSLTFPCIWSEARLDLPACLFESLFLRGQRSWSTRPELKKRTLLCQIINPSDGPNTILSRCRSRIAVRSKRRDLSILSHVYDHDSTQSGWLIKHNSRKARTSLIKLFRRAHKWWWRCNLATVNESSSTPNIKSQILVKVRRKVCVRHSKNVLPFSKWSEWLSSLICLFLTYYVCRLTSSQ